MHLSDLWFIAIAVLWAGYFILEGFDFGVGMLLPVLGRDDRSRRVMINAIGPVWDGNEVWVLTAGGATFAAFPAWYASLFSALYLPLLLILAGLIIRGVAFEYRGKRDSVPWKAGWDAWIFAGSLLPAVLWGVAFANIVRGIPLDAAGHFTGNLFTLLSPYALLGGLTTLTLFLAQGARFLELKTSGPLRARAQGTALITGVASVIAGGGFLAATMAAYRRGGWNGTAAASVALAALAAVALIAAIGADRLRRGGIAFAASCLGIGSAVAALFTVLYPDVLPSTLDPAFSLTTANAASAHKTLMLMTIVAIIFLPLVLAYQAWSYWVFRKRLTAPAEAAPAEAAAPAAGAPDGAAPDDLGGAARHRRVPWRLGSGK